MSRANVPSCSTRTSLSRRRSPDPPARSRTVEKLREVGYDDGGAVPPQRLGLPSTVDADDEPEPAGATGFHPGEGVLEHRSLAGGGAARPRRGEERIRRGLPLQLLLLCDHAVDSYLEQAVDPRGLEHLARVGAGRDDGAAEARVANGADVTDRAVVDLDPLLAQQSQNEIVLAVAKPMNGLGVRWIVEPTLGQLDPASLQERAHAVVTRLPVDILVVVVDRVEGDERAPRSRRARPQELVEHRLP